MAGAAQVPERVADERPAGERDDGGRGDQSPMGLDVGHEAIMAADHHAGRTEHPDGLPDVLGAVGKHVPVLERTRPHDRQHGPEGGRLGPDLLEGRAARGTVHEVRLELGALLARAQLAVGVGRQVGGEALADRPGAQPLAEEPECPACVTPPFAHRAPADAGRLGRLELTEPAPEQHHCGAVARTEPREPLIEHRQLPVPQHLVRDGRRRVDQTLLHLVRHRRGLAKAPALAIAPQASHDDPEPGRGLAVSAAVEYLRTCERPDERLLEEVLGIVTGAGEGVRGADERRAAGREQLIEPPKLRRIRRMGSDRRHRSGTTSWAGRCASGGGIDRATSIRRVRRAVDLFCRFFDRPRHDAAPVGHAERAAGPNTGPTGLPPSAA